MKSHKATDEVMDVLEHEADIRMQRTSYKVLSAKTGLSAGYISNLIGKIMREKSGKSNTVPRGTSGNSHKVQVDIEELAEQLRGPR